MTWIEKQPTLAHPPGCVPDIYPWKECLVFLAASWFSKKVVGLLWAGVASGCCMYEKVKRGSQEYQYTTPGSPPPPVGDVLHARFMFNTCYAHDPSNWRPINMLLLSNIIRMSLHTPKWHPDPAIYTTEANTLRIRTLVLTHMTPCRPCYIHNRGKYITYQNSCLNPYDTLQTLLYIQRQIHYVHVSELSS